MTIVRVITSEHSLRHCLCLRILSGRSELSDLNGVYDVVHALVEQLRRAVTNT